METSEQNAALVDELALPFSVLSDPEASVIDAYGVFDEAENVARPSVYVLDQAGIVRYAYVGRDYVDRPDDELLFATLDHW